MAKNDAARPKRPLPKDLSPAVAQAVLEDAMLEAAADIAALSATLGVASPADDAPLGGSLPLPETPEEAELMDLLGIPLLGPARRQLLADAGIETLADLHAVSPDTLGGIKGVGMANARRIKDWLAAQPAPQMSPAPTLSPSAVPPTPPTVSGASPDMTLAMANQQVQDIFGRIEDAKSHLKKTLPKGASYQRLGRQLAKLDDTASELAEGPDTLTSKQLQKALKILEKVVTLLEAATAGKPLSPKKQDIYADTVKEQRKLLEKALGG